MNPEEIDLVICATVTPDMFFPSTGNLIAGEAGCKKAFAYDVSAACSGFLFALTTASKFIETGTCKKVIVVGADKMSSIVEPAPFSATALRPYCSNPTKKVTASSIIFSIRTVRELPTSI